jgi:hypothetical protein
MPLIDSLPSGERVLLVNTTNLADAPTWMKLITRDGKHWLRALRQDRSIQLLRTIRGPASGVAVRGYLFVKRA